MMSRQPASPKIGIHLIHGRNQHTATQQHRSKAAGEHAFNGYNPVQFFFASAGTGVDPLVLGGPLLSLRFPLNLARAARLGRGRGVRLPAARLVGPMEHTRAWSDTFLSVFAFGRGCTRDRPSLPGEPGPESPRHSRSDDSLSLLCCAFFPGGTPVLGRVCPAPGPNFAAVRGGPGWRIAGLPDNRPVVEPLGSSQFNPGCG